MEPLEIKGPAFRTHSELIYIDAMQNQGERGEPIFFGEIGFFKATKKGNSTKILKVHYTARKIVFSGTLTQIKTDYAVLFSCLRSIYPKEKAFLERKTGAWFIDKIIIEKFLGYGFKSE